MVRELATDLAILVGVQVGLISLGAQVKLEEYTEGAPSRHRRAWAPQAA